MGNKAIISACDAKLRNINGVKQYTVACVVNYLPTDFDLNGIYCPVDPTDTVSNINNSIQQFGMDIINIEVPGAITNKNDVRLQGGFVS